MSAESATVPRGSKSRNWRRLSRSRSRYIRLSNIVSPGTSVTPPTTIRVGSPSACASTTWRTLFNRMGATIGGRASAEKSFSPLLAEGVVFGAAPGSAVGGGLRLGGGDLDDHVLLAADHPAPAQLDQQSRGSTCTSPPPAR